MKLRNLTAFTSPVLGLQTTRPAVHMGSGETANTVWFEQPFTMGEIQKM